MSFITNQPLIFSDLLPLRFFDCKQKEKNKEELFWREITRMVKIGSKDCSKIVLLIRVLIIDSIYIGSFFYF